ncbi:hypothetical protein EJ994_12705 [Maribacter sp. MJ134]|uniref:KAP family P-loop NTPase fold protein n=1 Tax=Maribacter sp. MJ134 TaxID=2496865 RepID=UPI000F82B925|nr:P-loop NTPase fold protein [Maribacter sp. MJ134]AZQ59626.1 hypothetical protein EJ994_12705 [Maribacter sp. MJ134]
MEIIKDTPILFEKDDLFNFQFFAKKVQRIIQTTNVFEESLSIGIYGKWGEGKTSFLNLLEKNIDVFEKNDDELGVMKYHFNPWRYGSEEEILFDFYEGLSTRLFFSTNESLEKAGKLIRKYGRYLKAVKLSVSTGVPKVFGTKVTFEPYEILKTLGDDLESPRLSLEEIKIKINEALVSAKFKIIVFIDDVDRLDKDEIYTILKIIKLNGNFKNLIYLITMDNEQVAKAINHRYGTEVEDGRLFLDKIINIPITLPKAEEADLKRFLSSKIVILTKNLGYELDEVKKEELGEIISEYKPYLFKSPREVIRVMNSFFFSAFAIGKEVNLSDLFWIEYLKIKYPKCYNEIKSYHPNDPMTALQQQITFNDSYGANVSSSLNGFRENLSNNYEMTMPIISRLFPLLQAAVFQTKKSPELYNKELRINHINHFDKYFSYHVKGKISELLIENFLVNVNLGNTDEANSMLVNFFETYELHKVTYRLLNLVEGFNDIENRNLFFKYIFKFRNKIPHEQKDMFGKNTKLEIIERIAQELNTNNPQNNEEIVLELAELLNYSELCYFIRGFKYQDFELKLKVLLIEKVKSLMNHPFYKESKNPVNKMVMSVWLHHKPQEFKDYLENYTVSKNCTGKLIQNFCTYWNNKFFGALSLDNFNYINELLDVVWVYSKVKKFYPELINMNIKSFDYNGKKSMTVEDNVKQFIYHYRNNIK